MEDGFGAGLLPRENTRRESVGRVLHEAGGFVVTAYFLDANDGAKAFLPHEFHSVIGCSHHDGGKEIARAFHGAAAYQKVAATSQSVFDLRLEERNLFGPGQRTEFRFGVGWVAGYPRLGRVGKMMAKFIVGRFVDVNSFDGAAALTGVVKVPSAKL